MCVISVWTPDHAGRAICGLKPRPQNRPCSLGGRDGVLSLPRQSQRRWPIVGVCELMDEEALPPWPSMSNSSWNIIKYDVYFCSLIVFLDAPRRFDPVYPISFFRVIYFIFSNTKSFFFFLLFLMKEIKAQIMGLMSIPSLDKPIKCFLWNFVLHTTCTPRNVLILFNQRTAWFKWGIVSGHGVINPKSSFGGLILRVAHRSFLLTMPVAMFAILLEDCLCCR